MRRLEWYLENFFAGVHSYDSRQAQSEVFAGNLQNVRAGPEGHLRQWSPVVDVADTLLSGQFGIKPVVGIGADESRWYRLHDRTIVGLMDSNGNVLVDAVGRSPGIEREASLHFRYLDRRVSAEDFTVFGGSRMEGRLSVIGEFRDFVIIGSEGNDRGYWVDMRDSVADDERVLQPLGMVPPLPFTGSSVPTAAHALEDGLYIYAFTNVRAFFGEVDDVALPRQVAQKAFAGADVLFNGMESNPTYMVVSVGGVDGTVRFQGEEITERVSIPSGQQGLFVADVQYPFDQQTGVYVYRAVGEVTERGDPVSAEGFSEGAILSVEALEFRVIDFLWKEHPRLGGQPDVAGTVHSAVSLEDRPLMRIDNDALPEGPFQLTYYNDLVVCATGDALRYSEVRFGAPVQWAFPVSNAIRIPGRVQFCVEYEGVLVFGGSQGMWRLTGTDEFNFTRDQFSAIGPVSRGAWGLLAKGIGFVSAGGLFVTDGVNVQKVSPGVLDGFFEGRQLVDGGVQLLPDGDAIWSVEYSDGVQTEFLQSAKGGWFIGSGIDALQSVSISEVDVDGNPSERVLYAGGAQVVEEILWNAVDRVDDDVAWFWESQELDWEAQGEGESLKVFKWLEIAASVESSVDVSFWVDDVRSDASARLRDGFRPVRVPIRKRGTRLKFRVSGSGEVRIRGMRLIVEVSDERRRF